MKTNPVKKTVEYCNVLGETKCDQFNYDSGGDAVCKKHKRGLSILGDRYRRPEWCTNETFVRVKINPLYTDLNLEYCRYHGATCNMVFHEQNGHDYCRITGDFVKPTDPLKRPEDCRKLEVE